MSKKTKCLGETAAIWISRSLDPNLTPSNLASDLDTYCLQKLEIYAFDYHEIMLCAKRITYLGVLFSRTYIKVPDYFEATRGDFLVYLLQ